MTFVLVVMGVTGSGKTTVGRLVAQHLGVPFAEGDEYHDPENVARMRAGHPLDDDARGPWLDRLNGVLRFAARHDGVVLACSALTEAYRRRLVDAVDGARFVLLDADEALLRRRLAGRRRHFAGATLLPSQFATLERPVDAIVVDVDATPDVLVDRVLAALGDAASGYDAPSRRRGETAVSQNVPTPSAETDIETLLRELGDLVDALTDTNDLERRKELWAEAKPRTELLDRLIAG